MPQNEAILADSSFYLCFLDDIIKPDLLKRIVDVFDFLITPIVFKEVSKSNNFLSIKQHQKLFPVLGLNFGEALRPFFSQKQIEKGETEVIEFAYFLYANNKPTVFIIDDKSPRIFVMKNLPSLKNLMKGTVGFVGDCYYKYAIFNKTETSKIVLLIDESKFRVSAEVIKEVLHNIESR